MARKVRAARATGFKGLFDAGHLSVVSGVGYPNPNRSHFRATEIWQTASDEDKYLSDGWLGRYFDNACQGCDPTVAINIGPRLPQAFSSHKPTGISLENPESYRFIGSGQFDGSQGTDHGAAAPMFLIGSKMKGLLGAEPSLDPKDLTDGDVKYNTDFRSVNASILKDWLKTNPDPILGKPFPKLPILAT